jgi:hypothetical protein
MAAATINTKEENKDILYSLQNYIEISKLNEIDKFVFKQSLLDTNDKSLKDWEKIKINIFS